MTADELVAEGLKHHATSVETALRCFRNALAVSPNHVGALTFLSQTLSGLGWFSAAYALAKRAVAVSPEYGSAHFAVGMAAIGLCRYREAVNALQTANCFSPELSAVCAHNVGVCCNAVGDYEKADTWYGKHTDGSAPVATRMNRAINLLAMGKIAAAAEHYEAGVDALGARPAIWTMAPLWKGEDLAGKRIVAHQEGGYGDTVMMARFLPELRKRGAACVGLAVPQSLVALLAQQDIGVDVVFDKMPSAFQWDYHIPLITLLFRLGITPSDVPSAPYLKAPPWHAMPPLPEGKKIGVAWISGHHNLFNPRRRLVELELLLPLAERYRLVSLQKDEGKDYLAARGLSDVVFDPMGSVNDFADTAALIDKLDAVVSVDSVAVHLAGSLGKPVVMLGQLTRCWRWWGNGTLRPWYETGYRFHQESPDEWSTPAASAVKRIIEILG